MSTLQLPRFRIRLFLDQDKSTSPVDSRTHNSPFFYAKADVQFELGLGWKGDLIDAGNLGSLVLELRPMGAGNGVPPEGTDAVMVKTVEQVTALITERDWRTGESQHALIAFSGDVGGETDIADGNYWQTVYGWTTDAIPRKIPFQPGIIRVLRDGSDAPMTQPPAGRRYVVDLPNVTSITAPDATGLAGQTTANYPLLAKFLICCPDDAPGGSQDDPGQIWRLEETTAANAPGLRQRGSDYHGVNNPRAFVRRG